MLVLPSSVLGFRGLVRSMDLSVSFGVRRWTRKKLIAASCFWAMLRRRRDGMSSLYFDLFTFAQNTAYVFNFVCFRFLVF